MNIIAKTTLVITTPTAKDNPFYGNTISRKTITDEYIMNKFEGVTCPNKGVEVGFKEDAFKDIVWNQLPKDEEWFKNE